MEGDVWAYAIAPILKRYRSWEGMKIGELVGRC